MIYAHRSSIAHSASNKKLSYGEPAREMARDVKHQRCRAYDTGLGSASAKREKYVVAPMPRPARPEEENWLPDALQRLRDLRAVQNGWDGYDAQAPASMAIMNAHAFVFMAWEQGLAAPKIAASVAEGVGFTFRKGDSYAFVEFYNNGTAYCLMQLGHGDEVVNPLPTDSRAMLDSICEIQEFLK